MTDRPTTVRFTPADLELIRQLQERTGIGTNSDVIRFALRYLERHGPMRPEEDARLEPQGQSLENSYTAQGQTGPFAY